MESKINSGSQDVGKMANDTDVNDNAAAKKCKKCNIVPVSGLKCVNCSVIMHRGCVKYYSDILIINEKYMKCCEAINDRGDIEDTLNAIF